MIHTDLGSYFRDVNGIRNIIFDLGGVIINLDYRKTRDAFVRLGVKNFDEIYSQSQQSGFFDALDKGTLSPEAFRGEIRRHIDHNVSDDEIDAAWNAMLLDVPREKIDLLTKLKSRYNLFLLSNTNVIHVKCFSKELMRVYGTPDFSPYFNKYYYSCDIGMRKPDAEIFQYVLKENNLLAAETLFIDDSIQHIRGAEKCELKTLFLEKGKALESLLMNAGILAR